MLSVVGLCEAPSRKEALRRTIGYSGKGCWNPKKGIFLCKEENHMQNKKQ